MDGIKQKLKFVEGTLYFNWDPIGVKDEFMAIDEYDSYAPEIVKMSQQDGFNEEMLLQYLLKVEIEQMGLSGNKETARRVAAKLVEVLK